MLSNAYLLTGGNLGDRIAHLAAALQLIEERLGKVLSISPVYETAPWGFEHETPFLNQAVLLETSLSPRELLHGILSIEESMGRVRSGTQWKERTIDIDILFYNTLTMDGPGLCIPHPRVHERKFALVPMSYLAADFVHPLLNKSIDELLNECNDPLDVKLYTK